ncbi:MAG: peptidylprolyl isomerase, partial [Spirochaetaceae bacterium]|nr:peptidylprolyl isomerase [Spirochaetaceae bacterium]
MKSIFRSNLCAASKLAALFCGLFMAAPPLLLNGAVNSKEKTVSDSDMTAGAFEDLGDGVFAVIDTTRGQIIVKLTYDKTPLTVSNFV